MSRPVSARFLQTIRGSHKAVCRATVCTTFQSTTVPVGTTIEVLGGDVTSSATSLIRSTLELTTSQTWPEAVDDLLMPYGNEIYIEKGVAYGNGQRELVGLGYFRINTPEQDQVPDGPITISASDRMAGLVDSDFVAPRQFPAAITRGQLVTALVTEVYPNAVISWDDTGLRDGLLGRTIVEEQYRAQCLADFMKSLGKVGYWRYDGVFRIETPPDISGAASWTVDSGANGVLIKPSRSLTREGVYNGVVATGEAADTTPPPRGVAVNLDPDSPTYWFGRFGPVPMFYSSPFLTSSAGAQQAARQLLAGKIGLPYQLDLTSLVNPGVEPYDVIEVRYPRTARNRTQKVEKHVVDTVKIGLGNSDPMTLETREQRVVLIGDPT